MSEEYDLKKSENKIGQLYPVLVTKDGKIIDGFHRKSADPNWKTLVVPEIDDEEKLLAARLIANFHRRQVSKEEKAEWINGLARLYEKQGLKVGNHDDGKRNEIKQKIIEVTGLSNDTVKEYLSSEFKQDAPEGGGVIPTPLLEKAEKALGSEGVKQLKKQILKEEKLSPQEKGALTRKRQQEREAKERKAEIKKREKEEKKKLDTEKRRKETEEREAENQRRKAEQEWIAIEKKHQEEEKRKKREEQIRKEAEESAKEKLLHDKQFLKDAAKMGLSIQDEETKQNLPIDEAMSQTETTSLPLEEVQEQSLKRFLNDYAEALRQYPKRTSKDEKDDFIGIIKSMVTKKNLHCSCCSESQLSWKCGHEF